MENYDDTCLWIRFVIFKHGRALLPSHIWQAPIQRNLITGEKIEAVDLKELLHLQEVFRLYDDGVAIFTSFGTGVEVVSVDCVSAGVRNFLGGMSYVMTYNYADTSLIDVILLTVTPKKIIRL